MVTSPGTRTSLAMSPREAMRYAVAFAWTFGPMYLTERLADYYYLVDNTASFYFMSGWRLILFIAFALCGSLGARVLLKDYWKAGATQLFAVAWAMALDFYICDPRVCFSAGLDGLEPLRLGFFLASVALSGAGLGVALRGRGFSSGARIAGGFFGFAAVGFYPVVFTFAGARILPPFYPWAGAAVLALAAFPISAAVALDLGGTKGLLVPLLSMGTLALLSFGIATAYLGAVVPDVAVLSLTAAGAAALGVAWATKWRGQAAGHRGKTSGLVAVGVVLVLVMMIFTTPDAVNGVVPSPRVPSFMQGVPVYAGGFMAGPPGHTKGAEVTVSFSGTNASQIQDDNYLSAGIGIHAAGCCVDGVDYSYRYDIFLFSSGNESMVASAWAVCDENAACGGHSWKQLMFLESGDLGRGQLGKDVTLRMVWGERLGAAEVTWSYIMAGGAPANFTDFSPPAAENHVFNTGVLVGGLAGQSQNASYFFQFGVMSRYPIGHGGWTVEMLCPSILTVRWDCIEHAMSLQGAQSYWKIFWRWGEDYAGASVVSPSAGVVRISYSGATTPSFRTLW